MRDLVGRRIGPYQVEAILGRGGMATVYRAYQASLNRYVAIKVLPPDLAEDAQFVARFRQEGLAAGRLSHQNILRIMDADAFEGQYYIVMDYVSGGTLADRLRAGPLPPDAAAELAAQVADGLDHAHRRGIVHRDLKPSNILIDEEGRPLLADFGIAQVLSSGPRLTQFGASIGTPEYMSPEQSQGLVVDGRSDIYSLGIVLYQMLSGRVPFQADTPVATLYQAVYQPPPPLRQINPRVPQYLETIVMRALAKNPDERFQTGAELANALRQQRITAVQAASLKTPGHSTGPTQLMQPGALPGGAAGASQPPRTGGQRAGPQQPRRSPAPLLAALAVLLLLVIAGAIVVLLRPGLRLDTAERDGGPQAAVASVGTAVGTAVTGSAAQQNALSATTLPSTAAPPLESPSPLVTVIERVITATPEPTHTPTPAPTVEPPTQTPIIVIVTVLPPTATLAPAATATPSPSAAPSRPPTAVRTAAATATSPQQSAAPAATLAPGIILNFETFGTWRRGDEPYGTFEQSAQQAHGGSFSARLAYDFPAVETNYVVFRRQPLASIGGQPAALTLWVFGDGSSHFLNAWVRDSQGELRSFTFGQVKHAGAWQPMVASLDTAAPWPQGHIDGPDNGRLDYPISLYAFVLDAVPDKGGPFSGALYLDDLTAGDAGGAVAASPTRTTPPAAAATPQTTGGSLQANPSGRIVYTSGAGISVLDVASKSTWPLAANGRQPDIRGDGRVVFNGVGGGKDNLFTIGVSGGGDLMIGRHPEDAYPHWSPSGVSVVFFSTLQGDGRERIYIQWDASVAQEPKSLQIGKQDVFGRDPTWLEDWRVAFSGCDYWAGGSSCGIWTLNSNGAGAPLRLTQNVRDRSSDSAAGVLLYSSADAGNWDVYSIPNRGGSPRNLTNTPSHEVGATFSPDGNHIAYMSDRGGWSIWVMNADGSGATKWLDVPAGFGPNWAEERLAWGR